MRKLLLMILIFTLFGNINNIFSWDSTAAKFLPLQVGNTWVYRCTAIGMACSCTKKYKFKVISSLNLNGRTYFTFSSSSINLSCSFNYCNGPSIFDTLRVDSVSGNLFKYSSSGCSNSPFEILVDSLNARLNDTVRNYCGSSQYQYICYDTAQYYIFGSNRRSKTFSEVQFETGYGRKFTEGIGVTESGYGSILCSQNSVLIGCVINGILYGDTSMLTGINQISSEVPEKFSLSQNYPNPFNPFTKLKFSIPNAPLSFGEGLGVGLIIYDVLGREVQKLVNEQLSPGTYEVDFDGSNLPSGVYYYTLISDSFTETKGMVLIK